MAYEYCTIIAHFSNGIKTKFKDETLTILGIDQLTTSNANLAAVGDAFSEGKYNSLNTDNYLGFKPIRLTLLRECQQQFFDLVVKAHSLGMFIPGLTSISVS